MTAATASMTGTPCTLHVRGGARARVLQAELRSLTSDGAELAAASLLATGTAVDVEAAGQRHAAVVREARPSSGGRWLMTLRLARGSWSYEMFRAAAQQGLTQTREELPDCLRALGLRAGATAADVESAYFALARRFHPDRGGTTEGFAALHAHYLAALEETGGRR